jgi:WD40 repeat protein
VSIWDVNTGRLIRQIAMRTTNIRSVAINPENAFVAAGGQNGDLFIWTMKGTRFKAFKGHDRPVIGLEFSPDGSSLLSGATDFTIRLWDIQTGFEVRRYTLDSGQLLNIQSLKFSDTGTTILTGLNDSTVRLWRMLPSIRDLLSWTFQNRYVPDLTCDQRVQFRLDLCDLNGNLPDSPPFEVPPVVPRPPSLLQLAPGMTVYINSTGGENASGSGTVFLRRSPETATTDNVIARLADGITVTLLAGPVSGIDNRLTWWKVQTTNGQEGFVAAAVPAEGLQLLVPLSAFEQFTVGRYAD